jgi:hypothetical protein
MKGNWAIRRLGIGWMALLIMVLLSACIGGRTPPVSQGEAERIAWEILKPFTDSQDRSNWAVQDTQIIKGDALPEAFQNEREETCFQWYSADPPPPENIRPTATYWLVEFAPLPATAQGTPLSSTAPPRIPEPFVRQAFLLIDSTTGQVDGFRLRCIIY